MEYQYIPKGICPKRIRVVLEGDVVREASFDGGCDGNLKAIGRLVQGKTVEQVEALLADVQCKASKGGSTSCSAQLAKAVRAALDEAQTVTTV